MYLLKSIPLFLIIALIPASSFSQSSDPDAAAEKRWHINEVLSSDNTLQLAKDIYQNKPWQLSGNNSALLLALLDSLPAMTPQQKPFYLIVIAKTFDKADGAYAEGLGSGGKAYIDSCLVGFVGYFTGAGKLPAIYLQKWAGIVSNEIELIKVNQDPKILTKIIKDYDNKCRNCRSDQKEILKQFENYIKTYVK